MVRPLRTLNRLLSAAISFTLVCASVVTIVEVILAGFRQKPLLFDWPKELEHLRRLSWDAASLQWTMILVGVASLAVLFLEITKRRPLAIAVEGGDPFAVSVLRVDLERALSQATEMVDDVYASGVKVKSRKKIRVRALAVTESKKATRLQIRIALQSYMEALHLARIPKIRVRVRKGKAL